MKEYIYQKLNTDYENNKKIKQIINDLNKLIVELNDELYKEQVFNYHIFLISFYEWTQEKD